MDDEIKSIRFWLTEGHKINLSPGNAARFESRILERIKGMIPPQQLIHFLNTSPEFGGVGIRIDTALKIGEKIETLLGEKIATLTPGGVSVGLNLS